MIETEDLPNEVARALSDLADHYQDFETIDRGVNGYPYFAKKKGSSIKRPFVIH